MTAIGGRRGAVAVWLALAVMSSFVATAPPAVAGAGDLDPSFGGGRPVFDGSPPVRYQAVTTQRDGRIVAAGTGWRNDQMDLEVVRYSSTGVLDAGSAAAAGPCRISVATSWPTRWSSSRTGRSWWEGCRRGTG